MDGIMPVLKQARYFVGNVVHAGPSLPSRQKWDGLYRLALQMSGVLDKAVAAEQAREVK